MNRWIDRVYVLKKSIFLTSRNNCKNVIDVSFPQLNFNRGVCENLLFHVLHNKFSNADWYRWTHGGTRYLLKELIFKLEDSIFQANFDELESTFFSKRSMGQLKVFVIEYLLKLQQGRLVYLWIIASHQMKSWQNFREW